MSPEIVVRRALDSDFGARAEIIRAGFSSYQWDAFLLFYFQELTLQGCVLGGAVLFIFCGVSAAGSALVVPAAAVVVAAAVALAHHALADNHVQSMRRELFGYVAEYRGPLLATAALAAPRVYTRLGDPPGGPPPPGPARHAQGYCRPLVGLLVHGGVVVARQVVGTASVSELCAAAAGGWLHALAVHPHWQRRGLGRALVDAVTSAAAAGEMTALHAVTSELQPRARRLLHAAGWSVVGAYHRRLCGAALTLCVAQLAVSLPRA